MKAPLITLLAVAALLPRSAFPIDTCEFPPKHQPTCFLMKRLVSDLWTLQTLATETPTDFALLASVASDMEEGVGALTTSSRTGPSLTNGHLESLRRLHDLLDETVSLARLRSPETVKNLHTVHESCGNCHADPLANGE